MSPPANEPFGPPEFQRETGVSDARLEKFTAYARLTAEWNERAGLVGDSTLAPLWRRHFMDCAQLSPLLPKTPARIADIGSGAGFPGMVLAMLGAPGVTLFERNTRKARFLQLVAEETGTDVEILNITSEEYAGGSFDIVTSRAAAGLSDLLLASKKLRKASTIYLFMKGKNVDAEIREAQKDWAMPNMRRIASVTDREAVILRLAGVEPLR